MQNPLVIFDTETLGLDPKKHQIIEIGAIAVDDDYNEISRFHTIIYANQYDIEHTDMIVKTMHSDNGLLKEVVLSNISIREADILLSTYFKSLGGDCRLAGNSIAFDRRMIEEQLPMSFQQLHYRMLELGGAERDILRKAGVQLESPGPVVHRSLPDCEAELLQLQRMVAALKELVARPVLGCGRVVPCGAK